MKRRIGAWVLLYALLASLSGTMLSCKSSAKPPAVASTSAKAQDSALPIDNGYKVTMDYRILRPDNTVIDPGKDPVSFTQGKHEKPELVPEAVETAVVGMKMGERKRIPLTPDQAFGPYDESKKITVKREQLRDDAKVGGLVKSKKDDVKYRIVDLSDSSAVLDSNRHALAGKDLVYEVTILKVEKQP